MFRFLKQLIFRDYAASLYQRLDETRDVRVAGVWFKIKRLDLFDHLDGSQTLTQYFDVYKAGKADQAAPALAKVKKHYEHVFMSAVVKPELKRKDDPDDARIWVGEIIKDMRMASELYAEIMAFTDGKKKATWLNTSRS